MLEGAHMLSILVMASVSLTSAEVKQHRLSQVSIDARGQATTVSSEASTVRSAGSVKVKTPWVMNGSSSFSALVQPRSEAHETQSGIPELFPETSLGSPCVGTIASGEKYLSIRNQTIENKKKYVKFHGYRLIDLHAEDSGTQWRQKYSDVIEQKWKHVTDALSVGPPQGGGPCSVVLWIDADGLFTNFAATLESLVPEGSDLALQVIGFQSKDQDILKDQLRGRYARAREIDTFQFGGGVIAMKNSAAGVAWAKRVHDATKVVADSLKHVDLSSIHDSSKVPFKYANLSCSRGRKVTDWDSQGVEENRKGRNCGYEQCLMDCVTYLSDLDSINLVPHQAVSICEKDATINQTLHWGGIFFGSGTNRRLAYQIHGCRSEYGCDLNKQVQNLHVVERCYVYGSYEWACNQIVEMTSFWWACSNPVMWPPAHNLMHHPALFYGFQAFCVIFVVVGLVCGVVNWRAPASQVVRTASQMSGLQRISASGPPSLHWIFCHIFTLASLIVLMRSFVQYDPNSDDQSFERSQNTAFITSLLALGLAPIGPSGLSLGGSFKKRPIAFLFWACVIGSMLYIQTALVLRFGIGFFVALNCACLPAAALFGRIPRGPACFVAYVGAFILGASEVVEKICYVIPGDCISRAPFALLLLVVMPLVFSAQRLVFIGVATSTPKEENPHERQGLFQIGPASIAAFLLFLYSCKQESPLQLVIQKPITVLLLPLTLYGAVSSLLCVDTTNMEKAKVVATLAAQGDMAIIAASIIGVAIWSDKGPSSLNWLGGAIVCLGVGLHCGIFDSYQRVLGSRHGD